MTRYWITPLLLLSILLGGCTTGMKRKKMEKEVLQSTVLYQSDDWRERKAAVVSVSAYDIPQAFELLVIAAEDKQPAVRRSALAALSKRSDSDEAYEIVFTHAKRERNPAVYSEALKALIPFKRRESFDVYVKGLRSKDWLIREYAIRGMVAIEDPKVQQASIPYVRKAINDPNENVRIATLENVKIQDPLIYAEIRKFLFTDEYEFKVTMLVATLKALQGYDLDIRVKDRVKFLIVHQNKEVRILALRVIKAQPSYEEQYKK